MDVQTLLAEVKETFAGFMADAELGGETNDQRNAHKRARKNSVRIGRLLGQYRREAINADRLLPKPEKKSRKKVAPVAPEAPAAPETPAA